MNEFDGGCTHSRFGYCNDCVIKNALDTMELERINDMMYKIKKMKEDIDNV